MEKSPTSSSWLDKLYENSIEYFVNYRKHLKEYALAIAVVLLIRATVGVVYQIPTGSMIPTFKVGDTLLANRFYYGLKIPFTDGKPGFRLPAFKNIEVGDIAIFRGPREELFYQITLIYNPANRELINILNNVSSNKGIIDLDSHKILQIDKNYIINNSYKNELEIRLHKDIYKKYQESIQNLKIINLKTDVLIMSYRFRKSLSFFRQLINTPLSGLSMIVTALSHTPYLYIYAKVLTAIFPEWKNRQGEISFYPNRWIDTTKEYVKRVIAKGGDKVEIRNKEVYVNNQKLSWKEKYQVDPDASLFLLTQEEMPHSTYSKDKNFSHILRFSGSLITPYTSFDTKSWPYDVETKFSSQFRDNFGPIIVPKGHYFMMGDNRDESLDSRYIGAVPEEMISGTPMFIFFPWDRRGIVK